MSGRSVDGPPRFGGSPRWKIPQYDQQTPTNAMKIGTTLTNVLLVLISVSVAVAFALFAIEIYLRSQFSSGGTDKLQDMVKFNEDRGWELKPGTYRYFDPGAMTLSEIAINSLGLRGKEIQLKVSPNRERVTLLGDSFLFGMALNEADGVAGRVRAALGDRYEVINVSAPGYGTGQEILFLQHLQEKGYQWGSRVILAFFTNDIQDNLGIDYSTLSRQNQRPAYGVRPDGSLAIEKAIKPPARKNNTIQLDQEKKYLFVDFLRNRAELIGARFPFLVRMFSAVTGGIPLARDPGVIMGWYSDGLEARWEVTSRLIKYMANMVRGDAGVQFDIVFIPSPFQVEPAFRGIVEDKASSNTDYKMFLEDIDRPQRMLLELCGKEKIRCVDATGKLRVASKKQPTYFLREGHLNAHGVSAIQELFAELVRD